MTDDGRRQVRFFGSVGEGFQEATPVEYCNCVNLCCDALSKRGFTPDAGAVSSRAMPARCHAFSIA